MKRIIITLALLYLGFNELTGQATRTFNYQGVIRDKDGVVLNQEKTIGIKIIDHSTNTAVYEQSNEVEINKGLFNITIGPLPYNLVFNKEYDLAVIMDGQELLPRTKILGVPYSFYSLTSEYTTNSVQTLNNLKGKVNIAGLGSTTVTQSKDTIYIGSTIIGGTGIQGVENTDATIKITTPYGPVANISIADNSITTIKLANESVTKEKLAKESVITDKLAKESVTTDKLVNESVTKEKLAKESVITDKLAKESVTTDKLANESVTQEKLANESVTQEKLAKNIIIPVSGKAGGSLKGDYPNPVIADDSVKSRHIIKDAVGDDELQEEVFFGSKQVFIGNDDNDAGAVYLGGSNPNHYISKLLSHDNGKSGSLELYSDGNEIAVLGTSNKGSGGIWLTGANSTPNVYISHTDNYPNEGAVMLFDQAGNMNLGIYGNGDFWAKGEKSFIIDDPDNSSRKIKYTCIEGPEAGIYIRGKAKLTNGLALIELPPYFKSIASDTTITIQLTPSSLSSKGLAAEVAEGGKILVGELFGGKGNYEFYYTVYAVRKGYEDYEVYIRKDKFETQYGNKNRAESPQSVRMK